MARREHLTFDVAHNVGAGLFQQEALKRGLNRLHSDGWPTRPSSTSRELPGRVLSHKG
jgi:hypothetical protein